MLFKNLRCLFIVNNKTEFSYIYKMYLYCVCPHGELESNFIKIGICEDFNSLKKRYTTYYGNSFRKHHVYVDDISSEKFIHEKLKNKNLHIEKELYKYNKIHDFHFYVQQLNEIESNKIDTNNTKINKLSISEKLNELNNNDEDYSKYYNYKQIHVLEFLNYYLDKIYIKKVYEADYFDSTDNWYYSESSQSDTIIYYKSKLEFDNIWVYYISFCNNNKQIYKSKNKLKEIIQSMVITNRHMQYKKYIFEFKENCISSELSSEIDFNKYMLKKYGLNIDIKYKPIFEEYMLTNNISFLKKIACKENILKILKIDKVEIKSDILEILNNNNIT